MGMGRLSTSIKDTLNRCIYTISLHLMEVS